MAEEGLKFRPEGRKFIWGAFILGVIFGVLKFHFISLLFFIVALFFVLFFRDPERRIVFSPEFVLSPADGVVREIEEIEEGVKFSIFMSLFDCHVNRSPYTGVVLDIKREGKGFKAAFFKDSFHNVKNIILLDTACGTMEIAQITGLIARRIACWVNIGDKVEAGQRIGMIYFGSRVDLFVPGKWEIFVRKGMRVKAGVTLLGKKL